MDAKKNLDALAHQVKRYGLVLAYSPGGYATLAFSYPALPATLKRELRNHRRGLARLMLRGDIRLCPVAAHKSEWFYAGSGRYCCDVCRRIDGQLGMWQKVS